MTAANRVRLACRPEVVEVPLNKILPTRRFNEGMRNTVKFRCIEASLKELGLIEPLVVFPQPNSDRSFMLLDGHLRLTILHELGVATAKCLVSGDDEGFTYNHKVNRLSAIQEHFMLLRAIKQGVTEDRIARSLNVDIYSIRQKRDLLEGICPEAVQLLKDKRVTGEALRDLRKVKPMRQIEIAELMCAMHNFSVGYAKCLVAATPEDQMIDGEKKETRGLSPDDIARMEHEMESLGKEFKLIEESHGKNVLNLVLVVGYLKKLMDNARVVRFMSQNHPEILGEFQKLIEAKNIDDQILQ
ncbi:MAG: ParB N-terminal domain-containing protein [Planctomycetes bacterium]|nr:ParB N-terminal domain-containing protein [Planctomycetota bacterium]